MWQLGRFASALVLVGILWSPLLAQSEDVGGPVTGPPVLDAPFSAEATTHVRQFERGQTIERTGVARYYRDRLGRVRVEQTFTQRGSTRAAEARITIQPDPQRQAVFTLDTANRTANVHPRSIAGEAVGGGNTYSVPLGGPRWDFLIFSRGERLHVLGASSQEESLGRRRMEGVTVTGRRIVTTVPARVFGNEHPFRVVDERWESPELKLLIYARSSDPHTGEIEYRVTNINRSEQPGDLFVIPSDYTIASTGDNGYTTLKFAERQHLVRP